MKNYKDLNGAVHALDSEEFAYMLPLGCIEITQEEADSICALHGPSPAQLWSAYQRQALALLASNDTVAIRCVKAGKPYPQEWLDCDNALRAIVHATSGDPKLPLPAQPVTRPAGT